MDKMTFEAYLARHGSLVYKNVGVSMLPLLRQGRDTFTVRAVPPGTDCNKWDVVLYKRDPHTYVLHRIVKVHENSYDILGDNCLAVERDVPKARVIGVMTDFTRKNKPCSVKSKGYSAYVRLWVKPYPIRIGIRRGLLFFKRVARKLLPFSEK